MDAEDIAKLVGELEERIERLRVLYDQYFMGIEKIPPEVLKKDVERRMWVLRREKIRNTGTRFKFQTITQRLNTFQSYWMRICRDIENGTYKRDLMRAKRRFGPEATADQVRRKTALFEGEAPGSAPLDLDVDIELEDIAPDDDDLGVPGVAAAAASATPIAAPGKPPPRVPAAPPSPAASPAGRTGSSITAGAPAPFAIPARAPMRPLPSPLAAARGSSPSATLAPPRASHPTPAPVRAPAPEPTRAQRDDGELDAMLDAALGASLPPPPATRTIAPKIAAVARPRPSAPTSPSVAAPRPTASPTARPSDADRQIYNRLVDAKRANGESTANLTFEQLQRNLEATRAKLRDKSGGRAIDFDVVVKDGKTILKPTVK